MINFGQLATKAQTMAILVIVHAATRACCVNTKQFKTYYGGLCAVTLRLVL